MSRPKFVAGYTAAYALVESLLELIERRGVSRTDLARLNGVDRSTVTKWLNPERNLTVFTAAMIANSLGGELEFRVKDLQEAAHVDEFTINQSAFPVRMSSSEFDMEAAEVAAPASTARVLRLRVVETGAEPTYPVVLPR